MSSQYFCRHKILERYLDGNHHCIDCGKPFDIVPVGAISMAQLSQPQKIEPAEIKIEKPVEPKVTEDSYGKCPVWFWPLVIGSALIALGGIWALVKGGGREMADNKPCEPQVVEKIVEKPVKAECPVMADKSCPAAPACKPEIVYVPQAKPNCSAEIQAACSDCRKSLEFFLKKEKEPSFKLDGDDGGPVDEFDEEF